MSEKPEITRESAADRWIDDILDGAEPPAEVDSDAEQIRLSDLLFLHAALSHLHNPEPRAAEGRIGRLMDALRDEPVPIAAESKEIPAMASTGWRGSRRRWLMSGLSLAAGVSGVGLLLTVAERAATGAAHAAVLRSRDAASLPRDRQYKITSELAGQRIKPLCATLFVRGGRAFALEHLTPLGPLWLGRNGNRAWFAPVIGPVFVADDPVRIGEWVRKEDLPFPVLEITTALSRMADDYKLESTTERDARLSGGPLTRVHGIRREASLAHPPVIDLWADPESGMVRRLVLDWKHPAARRGVARVTFDLVDERPLPDDFYRHDAHHSAERPILEF